MMKNYLNTHERSHAFRLEIISHYVVSSVIGFNFECSLLRKIFSFQGIMIDDSIRL